MPEETAMSGLNFADPLRQCGAKLLSASMRRKVLPAAFLFVARAAIGADATQALEQPARHETWLHHVFGSVGTYAKSAAYAGIEQAKGDPYEWGGGVVFLEHPQLLADGVSSRHELFVRRLQR